MSGNPSGALQRVNDLELDPIGLLKDAVATPSVTGEEHEMTRLLTEVLDEHGVPYEVDEMGNVLAGDLSGLVLNAHLDTVPPGDGWEVTDPFDPTIRNGKLYGRGAADCKGGLAAATAAVVQGYYEEMPMGLLATVGEESSSEEDNGTLHVCRTRELEARAGIVCEPTDGRVHVGDRGRITLRVTVRGRSAHASTPEMGKNPIEAASRVVEALSKLRPTEYRLPEIGTVRSDLTVTRIEADGPSNVIPERCEMTVDYRTVPGESTKEVKRRVERVAKRAVPSGFEVSVGIESASRATVVNVEAPVVKAAVIAARKVGLPGKLDFKRGHCDIEYLVHEAGLDAVILGPSGGNIHGPDEWVKVEDVVRCARAYLACANLLPTPH
ncbi:Predicted deacylase [Methanopyrus kandleri AV19]|uniref:Predicted deacylase n=1 Tax=Methanopyrus kandleri (strain AV19 / DSM 6324 / JCM 9639 / NBRC 100938) TaxID=190192 RepID=Q8TV20_METKA|nr:Predicted deacylase [Methanopyrus kandleri AV19]